MTGVTATSEAPAMDAAASVPRPATGVDDGSLQELAAARQDARAVYRAAAVATVSGWSLTAFAAITVVSGIFSLPALLLGVGLGLVAWLELRGARLFRAFDPAAASHLGANQLGFAALLVLYGGWGAAHAMLGPGPYDEYLASGGELARTVAPIADLHRVFMVAFYALVIVCGAVVPGATAAYYFTRRRHVEAFLDRTPEWAVRALRAAAGVGASA